MKLSEWARKQGVTYVTAYRWFKSGTLPCQSRQLATGTILVSDEEITAQPTKTVIYCRVSNHSRKAELEYQVDRCVQYCTVNGYSITKIYREVASGMNDNRKILWSMLDDKPTRIVVENKDRFTRFGFNYLERLLRDRGCMVEVINQDAVDERDLIKDMVSIMTSFCCRLYGARRGQNKSKRIKEVIHDTNDQA